MKWKGGSGCGLIKVLSQNMHRKTGEDSSISIAGVLVKSLIKHPLNTSLVLLLEQPAC
jgi:hypothetical protein